MTKKYVYFVSYFFGNGHGRGIYVIPEKLESDEIILELEKEIEERHKHDEVIITNFILLREESGE